MTWLGARVLALGLASLAACSAVVEPDLGDLGPRPAACSPGSLNPFTCPDESLVHQVCTEQGSFSPAVCPPTACQPGAVAACACASGGSSNRICMPQGTWPRCSCDGATPSPPGAAGSPAPGG